MDILSPLRLAAPFTLAAAPVSLAHPDRRFGAGAAGNVRGGAGLAGPAQGGVARAGMGAATRSSGSQRR